MILNKKEELKNYLDFIPEKPGIYQFVDKNNKIIYIGKAINLKKRVLSYFNVNVSSKVKVMVKQAYKINHFVVANEDEALLLENNLIKKHQPKYNARLKDDKTFPWICIKNEPFPRVFSTRTLTRDGSKYFGPYTSTHTIKTLLELIRQLFPIRTCKYLLSRQNIEAKKFKVCLEYHIGNCKAPCIGLQSENEYQDNINQIINIIKGDIHAVTLHLQDLMKNLAQQYKFEEAELVKQKIEAIKKFRSKSTVVNAEIANADVFSIIDDESESFINYLKIIKGAIVQVHSLTIEKKMNETSEDILQLAVIDLLTRLKSEPDEVILEKEIKLPGKYKVTIPKIGDKKKILELSQRNCQIFRFESLKRRQLTKDSTSKDILEVMRQELDLKNKPYTIECFDNSNIQGTNPVASCVVFKNAKPSNKDYRHFNIKTVEGPNDFASMEEIIFRRYRRLMNEKKKLPDLIVIDGGKGQLSSAVKVLNELDIQDQVDIISIAKKLEEIFKPGDSIPIYIDKNARSLKVIQHIRNEAHRFGIEFHRTKRSAAFLKSELDEINGIGEKSKVLLLSSFDSIEDIRNAEFQDLINVIGKTKAVLLKKYFDGYNEL